MPLVLENKKTRVRECAKKKKSPRGRRKQATHTHPHAHRHKIACLSRATSIFIPSLFSRIIIRNFHPQSCAVSSPRRRSSKVGVSWYSEPSRTSRRLPPWCAIHSNRLATTKKYNIGASSRITGRRSFSSGDNETWERNDIPMTRLPPLIRTHHHFSTTCLPPRQKMTMNIDIITTPRMHLHPHGPGRYPDR